MRWLAVSLLIAPMTSGAVEGESVSFEADLLPVLKARCAVCHMTGKEPGGMALTPDKAWSDLVSQDALGVAGWQRVAPGDPDASYLMHKLWGSHRSVGGSGSRMPMHQPALPKSVQEQFASWILAGALDN
jgi:hypothetical protein